MAWGRRRSKHEGATGTIGLSQLLGYDISRSLNARMDRIIQDHQQELEALCARFGVRRLELFGSAAGGSFDPGSSDIDFLVELKSTSRGELVDRYFGLLEALEELFGRPIDLVMAGAIKNPYFLQVIESSRTLLYAA
jgi:predicted nucleotidyltransferase